MKKFNVTVDYQTPSGKAGSKRFILEAKNEDEAIAKSQKIIKRGYKINGGSATEIKKVKTNVSKVYKKFHKNIKSANKHKEKIDRRGGSVTTFKQDGGYLLVYGFPTKKKK